MVQQPYTLSDLPDPKFTLNSELRQTGLTSLSKALIKRHNGRVVLVKAG